MQYYNIGKFLNISNSTICELQDLNSNMQFVNYTDQIDCGFLFQHMDCCQISVLLPKTSTQLELVYTFVKENIFCSFTFCVTDLFLYQYEMNFQNRFLTVLNSYCYSPKRDIDFFHPNCSRWLHTVHRDIFEASEDRKGKRRTCRRLSRGDGAAGRRDEGER